ncbi:kinase-like domain-containing protein [Lophiotrema nucula]|uniref:Kinase-like domain-containing protein n=1 Tax=Lophiotrema nucula TaxID=690887 RepID=A0A6A5YDY1_9PLEO|nr:kinase-like domain-containing protein [Lophiotrema nucula]
MPPFHMADIRVPYFASSENLPHRLPTPEQIRLSENISTSSGRQIVQVDSHFVAKFGTGVDVLEGFNMLFVSEHTRIPIPRVYAIYSVPSEASEAVNYIVMENVSGDTLATRWPTLRTSQKEQICAKLEAFCSQLRRLPSPNYLGSLGERPLLDPLLWTHNSTCSGPFKSEAALSEAMVRKYMYNGPSTHNANFYRAALPAVFSGHPPVFTHGDLQRKNILIKDTISHNSDENPEFTVVIVDWEFSGWYPSYWEFVTAMCASGRWDDDWHEWVRVILPDCYFNEYAWIQMLRQELWS